MNSSDVWIVAIAAGVVLAVIVLGLVAAHFELVSFSWSWSLRFIPAAKRKPRTAVEVKVVPGLAEPPPAAAVSARYAAAKLNPDQVAEIRSLKGVIGARRIARQYGVGRTAVQLIHQGKTWRDADVHEIRQRREASHG